MHQNYVNLNVYKIEHKFMYVRIEVSMYACTYVYICMYKCTYIHIYVHTYIYLNLYIHKHKCIYIYTQAFIHTYIHTFLHRHHTYALNTTHYVQDITYIACESTCRVRSYHILRYIKDIKGLMLSDTKQQHTQPFITKIVICEIK